MKKQMIIINNRMTRYLKYNKQIVNQKYVNHNELWNLLKKSKAKLLKIN